MLSLPGSGFLSELAGIVAPGGNGGGRRGFVLGVDSSNSIVKVGILPCMSCVCRLMRTGRAAM